MKAVVKWQDHIHFIGETGSGHTVLMDGSPEHGGQDKGARPMEMILLGLGGCASIDLMLMLEKSRQQVTDCRVEISAERADAVPAVFTSIHLEFVVTGRELSDKHVARAVELSATKYCSVSKMLESSVALTHTYRIEAAE